MKEYLNIVNKVLKKGELKHNRTGVDAYALAGSMFEHNMGEGFPLLTTKKVAYENVKSELEFFLKGFSDKKWLQKRNNHIWDEWCSPELFAYGDGEEIRKNMKEERDLGPIYGF